ncbi:MAG: shikimate kinase [Gemmatimonadota bacterium]|nr:shikimate kinase [Gemmatimonadota bacterium]
MSTNAGADSRAGASPGAPRSIVLVGLPGAGKSTVGALVAERLGWPCIDFDRTIERAAGCTIAELFAEAGEGAFRAWERRLTAEMAPADGPPVVLVPGGGWVEDPDHRARFGVSWRAIYLAVSPEVAVHRMGATVADRPLLRGLDPVESVRNLLRRREALYLQSNHVVSTDSMGADEVATLIVALALGQRPD